MPNNASSLPIVAAKLFAASLLITAFAPQSAAQQSDETELGYLAGFTKGTLKPTLDLFDFGPLEQGHSQHSGNDPQWIPNGGDLILKVTRPPNLTGSVASVGVFVTSVQFGPGTLFKTSATFIRPKGPDGSTDVWAMVLGARTGDNDDLFEEVRVGVSLQVRGTSLRFNAPGSGSPGPDLPSDVYGEIFAEKDPKPFTLELLVDRISGAGRVSVIVGKRVFSRAVSFPPFPADSGPVITAVGPSVGIVSAPGKTASVQLREFRMFLPSTADTNSADTCPDTWDGFYCREPAE